MLLVPGNHERSTLPHSPIFHHPRFHVFDRSRTFSLEVEGEKVSFGGFPDIRHNVGQSFRRTLEETKLLREQNALKILCMHQAIENAVVGVQNYQFRKDWM